MSDRTGKLSLPDIADMAHRGQPIVMVTAYDAPSARLADEAGVDIVLVGDSAGTTVLGGQSTVPVTMDEMLVYTRAVSRGTRRALVVADMPFGSYQVSEERAVESAIRFVKEAGADAVKLEGAGRTLTRISGIREAGIAVTSWVHPLRGMQGEELATDTAWVGPKNASRVLVVCSGTHGVEGHYGSGCQVGFLRERGDRREWRDLMDAQATSLAPVWDNPEDKVWDNA